MFLSKIFSGWRNRAGIVAAALMITVLLVPGCSTAAPANSSDQKSLNLAGSAATVQVTPLFDEANVVSLYERCIPAVVQVESVTTVIPEIIGPFGLDIPKMRGQGSGFIIDAEGHSLTNNRVVD